MNIVIINITHFLDMSLFHFIVESDIMLVTIFNIVVTVAL